MSTLEAQMTHAAWDAALPFDMEEEARRNPFLAAHMARCDAEMERRRIEQEHEQE
jgi:hypothetical protein